MARKRRRRTPKESAKAASAESKGVDNESGGEGPVSNDDGEDVNDKKCKIKHEETEK